ncbi:MAG: double zinc ribbon domain-containing protein, partial [Boseongicola sp.]
MHRAFALIYPDQCVLCTNLVDGPGALCASCWHSTPFINGNVCDKCGTLLIGPGDGSSDLCDDCIALPRPWSQGRAVFGYRDSGRRLVLALKHGDRTDLVPSAAGWMARAGAAIFDGSPLLVPIPIHWTRLVRRKFNQAAELAKATGAQCDLDVCLDALKRARATKVQDGMNVEARFANLENAIIANPARASSLEGRDICLIDDVMTSGATLAVATQACLDAGARRVSVLVLAR